MRTALTAAVLTLSSFAAAAAPAATGPTSPHRWTFRLQGIAADPPADVSFTLFDSSVAIGYDTGLGFGASIEYRLSQRLGIDFSTFYVEHDVEVAAVGPASAFAVGAGIELIPSTIGLVVHVTPGSKLDLYLLAGVGVLLNDPGPRRFSGDIVAAGLGLDVAIADQDWALTSSVRYLTTPTDDSRGTGPLLTLGVARRF